MGMEKVKLNDGSEVEIMCKHIQGRTKLNNARKLFRSNTNLIAKTPFKSSFCYKQLVVDFPYGCVSFGANDHVQRQFNTIVRI